MVWRQPAKLLGLCPREFESRSQRYSIRSVAGESRTQFESRSQRYSIRSGMNVLLYPHKVILDGFRRESDDLSFFRASSLRTLLDHAPCKHDWVTRYINLVHVHGLL